MKIAGQQVPDFKFVKAKKQVGGYNWESIQLTGAELMSHYLGVEWLDSKDALLNAGEGKRGVTFK